MIWILAVMAAQVGHYNQPPPFLTHEDAAGPVPTKLEHSEGVSCPAGALEVSVSERPSLPKDRVSLTSVRVNGEELDGVVLQEVRLRFSRVSVVTKVEVGCFSAEEFIVDVFGETLKQTSGVLTFIVGKQGVLVVPDSNR